MVLAMLIAVGGLAGVMYYIFQERSPLGGPTPPTAVAQAPSPSGTPASGTRGTQAVRDPNAPIPVPGLSYTEDAEQFKPDFTIGQPVDEAEMNDGMNGNSGSPRRPAPAPAPVQPEPEMEPMPDPSPNEPPAMAEPPAAMANLPATPMPAPQAEADTSAAPTAEQAAAFDAAIRASFEALGSRDLDGASQQLAVASENAISIEQRKMLRGMEAVKQGVEAFWDAARDGLKGLVGTNDELELQSGRVGIVEATPEYLILRIAGQNRRFEFDSMPSGLAKILAERWFDENAASTKIFLGSFMLVDPAGDKEKVRQLWQEAASSGIMIDELLPLLDLKE